ncbi:hypothetical protein IYX23_05730 [Methylocystis sp. L43]|jgi:hypothetical protein|uniref:hypothetical protein n=1 Tax=unclassified Methylocystis TaxID=2625913 RepID=UPI0018C2CB33|nr:MULTISPECIES: hypothetical protein [unclassified Methylocystis]MBG0797187.1 hypothetical protein [Methylocystis sp. L43]MBG0804942.1 hypothetical protein [Methylocystis sp. H15]
MTQQEERRSESAQPAEAAAEVAAEGRRRLEDFSEARTEIWDCLQDANRVLMERMQQEAALTAELASKLTASRSFSETASVLQNWTSKHIEMTTEDTRRLFSDAQQMLNASTRFWSNSAQPPSPETAGRFMS